MWRRLIATVIERYERLDVVINNAGTTEVIPHPDLDAATPEVWRRLYDTNVIGPWLVSTAAVPHLRQSRNAVIVNVSSLAGDRPIGSSIPYVVGVRRLTPTIVSPAKVLPISQ